MSCTHFDIGCCVAGRTFLTLQLEAGQPFDRALIPEQTKKIRYCFRLVHQRVKEARMSELAQESIGTNDFEKWLN